MIKTKLYSVLVATVLLSPITILGQDAANSEITSATCPAAGGARTISEHLACDINGLAEDLSQETDSNKRRVRAGYTANLNLVGGALALRYGADDRASFVKLVQEARSDVQVSSPSSSNAGSTTVASKGSTPAILGFGVENGALTQTVSGTTITFQGNPAGIISLLATQNFLTAYDKTQIDGATKALANLSFAVSFDASRGSGASTSNPVFTGNGQQVSSYSFHYDIINKRDPRGKYYTEFWNSFVKQLGQPATDALANLVVPIIRDNKSGQTGFNKVQKDFEDTVANEPPGTSKDKYISDIKQYLLQLVEVQFPDTVPTAAKQYFDAQSKLLIGRGQLLDIAAHGPLLTFDYINQRPDPATKLPSTSTFRVVGETGLFAGQMDFTANLSFNIWNTVSATTSNDRLAYVDLSAQLDVPLANPQKLGNWILTGAYKYRDYTSTGFAPDGTTLVPKGVMNLGQVKLSIPVKGSGIKIPVSVSFANRSEYIKESEVRGNIGVTFDIDTILAGLSK